MLPSTSTRKKPKSPGTDPSYILNPKTSVICANVPEGLFDALTAKKHFSKFGRVLKIRLFPKRHTCIIEYDQPLAAERALLNAGAFDGFMFEVTRTKLRTRKKSKREEDPDWVPDSDVEEELSAMSGGPAYRITRQKPMDIEAQATKPKTLTRATQQSPVKTKASVPKKPVMSQPASGIESPVPLVTTQTTLNTFEAAAELHLLRSKTSLTPDEQWRILDARDRILRAWGGAGSRVQVGGATIGTCQDMCPEKELLHRQAEHQVMTLETVIDSDGLLEPWRAVKQYSRSSADQEMPMCYELRPAAVLTRTCAYLLHEIADTQRQVTLSDWFHFMWDRFRSIRKDITQQALCCADSIRLVEMCARFHAHCAARLADLEHTQFDQKLNTDNLTKCLQTLKHMYADVTPDMRPREAEFRGYIALLNLGDANFWWEIKQLPLEIQKSEPIVFAIQVFNAIDNNNYVRFFRLVHQKATYLQACILLRYFNDVRARALARIVKAYAPRGGSRFPAADLMSALAFESVDKMKAFINHYGLRFGRIEEHELSIILSRHQFIEDSDPFPIARAINLIESKRQCSVGEVIAGGPLPNPDYSRHVLHTSFTKDGKLKDTAFVAEEQGYNTMNDSNKDVKALKAELQRLAQGGRSYTITDTPESKTNLFLKPESKSISPRPKTSTLTPNVVADKKLFSFKPAITVEPTDVTKNSPEKIFDSIPKNIFSFSKPDDTAAPDLLTKDRSLHENKFTPTPKGLFENSTMPDLKYSFEMNAPKNIFQNPEVKSILNSKETPSPKSIFGSSFPAVSKDPFENKPATVSKSMFENRVQEPRGLFENKSALGSKNLFMNTAPPDPKDLFGRTNNEKKDPFQSAHNVFQSTKPDQSVFNKPDITKSIFGNTTDNKQTDLSKNVFGTMKTLNNNADSNNIFAGVEKKSTVFEKPSTAMKLENGTNLFTKHFQQDENTKEPHQVSSFNKPNESTNIFTQPVYDVKKQQNSIFASNGESPFGNVSPGSFFKSILNQPQLPESTKNFSIYQSKNKAQTVADNIITSVNAKANAVFEFNQNEEEQQKQLEFQRLNEEKIKEEQRKLQQQRLDEERRQQELRRQEQIRRQEELRRQEEARRKQEELRLIEEQRRREEQRKQDELRKKLEEERKAELKRLAEEQERKFREAVEKESTQLVDELVNEINNETSKEIIKEEQQKLRALMQFANNTSEEIITQLCSEICHSELKAEMFLTFKLMRKWFYVWRQQFYRNLKRRTLLEDTPVWLPERTPAEEASHLRRNVEDSALKNMKDIHNGYKFSGELKQLPAPQPYNLMELIRSPLLKRMKHINYPYDKCFFWKVTLVAPGEDEYLCRKINIHKWLIDAFSDMKKHEESETLLQVGRVSWNHLMDFAISVSLLNKEKMTTCAEAVEGTNGVLFYSTEKDNDLKECIQKTLKPKYPYQVVPVAIIMPRTDTSHAQIQNLLASYVEHRIISGFKIFLLDPQHINELLNESTKRALRWLAKKYPQTPPLEIDSLKSICQRYLGNEIWCRLRIERDGRMRDVVKDIYKLIQCYNAAVDRLTTVITNEDLFNYTSFPLEFKPYLDHTSPYPKPHEFITSNVRTSENISTIRDIMRQLKLPNPFSSFNPLGVRGMQKQIRTYCNQIGWFENPEEVVCKVVAVMPNELTDLSMSQEDFTQYFAHYDLIDFLNIIVYEKINRLNRFDNRFAIYEPTVLHEYRNIDWLYEVDALAQMKHKVIEYEDDLDYLIEAKRRKIEMDSLEYLMLEDKDSTLVEENIKETDANITKYSNCTEAVKQLEEEIEEGKKKSVEFENMLRAALADV